MGRKKTTTYGKNEILSAVEKSDLVKLKQIFNYYDKNKKDLATVIDLNDSVLSLSLATKNPEILELFLNKTRGNIHPKIQDRLLHESIELNDPSILDILIKHEFLKNSTCDHQLPPLFELIGLKRFDWIEKFYKAGVPFDQKTGNGVPILHFALRLPATSKELIKHLLSYGAEVSAQDDDDLTPLQFILTGKTRLTRENEAKFIKLLLKFGADPNVSSESINDEPVFYTAMKRLNYHAVRLLLMYGANINDINLTRQRIFKHSVRCFLDQTSLGLSQDFVFSDNFWFLLFRHLHFLQIRGKYVEPCLIAIRERLEFHGFMNDISSPNPQGLKVKDILAANEIQLTKMMKNPQICEYLLSKSDMDKCSQWNLVLKFLAKQGKEREILLTRCEEHLMRISGWKLTRDAVQNIFNYLGRTDLRCLLAASCPESFLERLTPKSTEFVVRVKEFTFDDDEESETGVKNVEGFKSVHQVREYFENSEKEDDEKDCEMEAYGYQKVEDQPDYGEHDFDIVYDMYID